MANYGVDCEECYAMVKNVWRTNGTAKEPVANQRNGNLRHSVRRNGVPLPSFT